MWTTLAAALSFAIAPPPVDDIDPAPKANDPGVLAQKADLDTALVVGPSLLEHLAGRHAWQIKVSNANPQALAVLRLIGNRLFLCDGLNRLHCILVDGARTLWVSDMLDTDNPMYSVHPARRNGRDLLYVVHDEGLLLLDADTGVFADRARVDFFPGTAGVEYGDALIFGNTNGRIGWELMATGVPWWTSLLQGAIRTPPVLMGQVVAAASDKGQIGFWVAQSSQLIRLVNVGGGIHGALSSNFDFGGNLLFCASEDQSVYAFQQGSGERAWKYFTESPITASTVCIEDRVYVQIPGEGLVALAADGGGRPDGKVIWKSTAPGDVVGLFANRVIVFDHKSGILSAVEPLDGTVIVSAPTPIARAWASSPKDGDLYFVSLDGRVQRVAPLFASPSAGPAPTPAAPSNTKTDAELEEVEVTP